MPTTVVNIYTDDYDVYIGRAGKGQDGYWGNPFNGSDRDKNIDDFREYFHQRIQDDPEFRLRAKQLKHKRLGCFCKSKNPLKSKRCHGDIIAEYVNSLPDISPPQLAVNKIINTNSIPHDDISCL